MRIALYRHFAIRAILLVAVLAALGLLAIGIGFRGDAEVEVARLTEALDLEPGITVAEIGAGDGWLTVEVANQLGAAGHVFSTELSEGRRAAIEQAVVDASLANVTVVAAGEDNANLAADCCDAIFMRRVYHHLSDAAAINKTLYAALKPSGTLAVIEFTSDGWLGRVTGMGITPARLESELVQAGFEHVETNDWPGAYHYIAVFTRP